MSVGLKEYSTKRILTAEWIIFAVGLTIAAASDIRLHEEGCRAFKECIKSYALNLFYKNTLLLSQTAHQSFNDKQNMHKLKKCLYVAPKWLKSDAV